MTKELDLILNKLYGWYETFVEMMPNIVLAILIAIATVFIARGLRILLYRYALKRWKNEELKTIFAKIFQFVIVVLGFLLALSVVNLNKTVTSILAGVGVAGIAIGFAFQDIAANFISGLFMASNKPFQIGDLVEIADETGYVKEMRLRTTTITTLDGNDIVIPNLELFQNPLINYSKTQQRRVRLEVGVTYEADLRRVKKLVEERISQMDGIVKDKGVKVLWREFGDSSINFELRFWVPEGENTLMLEMQSEAIMVIKELFDENGISIPFPIRTLDLERSKNILQEITT